MPKGKRKEVKELPEKLDEVVKKVEKVAKEIEAVVAGEDINWIKETPEVKRDNPLDG